MEDVIRYSQKNEEYFLNSNLNIQKSNGAASRCSAIGAPNIRVHAEEVKPAAYPFWRSVRFLVVTLLGFAGTVNLFALRVNLSIALPCLVFINDTRHRATRQENSNATASLTASCVRPAPDSDTASSNVLFVWTGEMKGLVNGFFYVGYSLFQIPSALLAARLGPKRAMLAFMSVATLATLAQHPLAALVGRDAAHWSFIVLRFLNGAGCAAFFPVYTALLANWAPPLERSRMMATAYAGMNLGIILTFTSGGFLCKWLGWPALFYIPGLLSIVWLALWALLVADTPEKHHSISAAERDYIHTSLGDSSQQISSSLRTKDMDTDSSSSILVHANAVLFILHHIVTSPCVLALYIANVAFNYGSFTILTTIPSFMDEVLFFNIEENGVLSAIPYLLEGLVIVSVGHVVDHLLDRQLLPLLFVRKAVNTIGLVLPAIVMCLLAFTDCSRPVWALVILSVAVALDGFCYAGCFVNYMEVAPRYSGAIFAVGNSFASITGLVGPFLVGAITSNHTHAEWSVAFFVCAGVMAVGALVYLVFARADVQRWALEGYPYREPVVAASTSLANVDYVIDKTTIESNLL